MDEKLEVVAGGHPFGCLGCCCQGLGSACKAKRPEIAGHNYSAKEAHNSSASGP